MRCRIGAPCRAPMQSMQKQRAMLALPENTLLRFIQMDHKTDHDTIYDKIHNTAAAGLANIQNKRTNRRRVPTPRLKAKSNALREWAKHLLQTERKTKSRSRRKNKLL